MARDDPEVRLRLPTDLKTRIEAASRQAGRSMNAEIVQRLERSFENLRLPFEALSEAAMFGMNEEQYERLFGLFNTMLDKAMQQRAADALADHQRDSAEDERG